MAAHMKAKIIRWSDPPERGASLKATHTRNKDGWDKILARLDERPGEWALIRTSDKRYTVTQTSTQKRRFKNYEFVSRKYYVGKKAKFGVWARRKPNNSKHDIVKEQFITLTMGKDEQ